MIRGRIAVFIVTAATLALSAGAILAYRLTIRPMEIGALGAYLSHKAKAFLPGATASVGEATVGFDVKTRSLVVDFYDNALIDDQSGADFFAPHIRVSAALAPGGEQPWNLPAIDIYRPRLRLALREGEAPGEVSAEETGRRAGQLFRRVVKRSRALAALSSICAHDADILIFSSTDEPVTRRLSRLCVSRDGKRNGKRSLNLAMETEGGEGDKTRVLASFFAERDGMAGLSVMAENARTELLRGLPQEAYLYALAPALKAWELSGKFDMFITNEGALERATLSTERAKATFDRFFDRKEKATVLLSHAEIGCEHNCRDVFVTKGRAFLVEAGVEGDVRAELHHDAASIFLLRTQPEKLRGTATFTLSGLKTEALYTVLEGLGLSEWRNKMEGYLSEGTVKKGAIALRLPAALTGEKSDASRFSGEFSLENATLLAPNREIYLSGVDADVAFVPDGAKGTIFQGAYKSLRVKNVAFDVEARRGAFTATGNVSGRVKDATDALASHANGLSDKLRYLMAHTNGDADADFTVAFPTTPESTLKKDVDISVRLRHGTLPFLFPETSVSDAMLDVTVKNHDVGVAGTGIAHRVVSEAEEDALVRIPPHLLSVDGPVSLTLAYAPAGDHTGKLSIDVRADNATVGAPFLGYQKYPGVPASFSLKGDVSPGTLDGTTMRYESGGDKFVASDASFSREKTRVLTSEFKQGGHDLAGEAVYSAENGLTLRARGKTVNALALYDMHRRGGPHDHPMAIDAVFEADKALWKKGRAFYSAKGRLECNARRYCRAMELSGRPEKGGSFLFAVNQQKDGRRTMRGESDDAGALLALLGSEGKIQGGRIDVDGEAKGSGDALALEGTLNLYNFRAMNLALIKHLPFWREEGYPIDRFKAPFSYERGVIRVIDAATIGAPLGATIGATADGTIDLTRDAVRLRGVMVPAQGGVNKLVATIPIVGKLVTGGKNEGLIGVNYEINGAISDPKLSVNPLSILTPGILRKIFSGLRS
ncbi:MAG: AsmA-like C-terminal region-containing protein [Rickettsiales bacterium]